MKLRILLGLLVLTACDGGAAPGPGASAAASAPAPSAVASARATASATAMATATATATAAAVDFTPSAEPELAEWGAAREIAVSGSGKNHCETKMVREWLRVMCVPRSTALGKPRQIEVTSGRAANERYRGENLRAVNDITTLVTPVRPGTAIVAAFAWEDGQDVLRATWPAGKPETSRVIAFDQGETSADAAPLASASASPPPGAFAEMKPEPELEPLPDLGDPPTDEAWAAAPEARVTGSTALECTTRLSGKWFRASCGSEKLPAFSASPLKGARTGQTRAEGKPGKITFTTPYVEGTELVARFDFATERRFLVLRWKKGDPRPATVGAFETGK